VLIPIDLPVNTVEWYYAYTVARSENTETASINLLAQLTKILDPTGVSAVVTGVLLTPTGSGVCDIYLLDQNSAPKFKDKVDNFGGSFNYVYSGTRENAKNNTVQIKDVRTGRWFLGLKNPSLSEGINLTIEAVAVIEENINTQGNSQVYEMDDQKAITFGTLGWNAYQRGEYEKSLELSRKALEFSRNQGWIYNIT